MLYNLIHTKAKEWLASDECTIKPIFEYIVRKNNLREAQFQALLVYLFLKIKGKNKPLYQLFSEGFFCQNLDLSSLNINQKARNIFESNPAARALFELSITSINSNSKSKKQQTPIFPELEQYLLSNPDKVDYQTVIKSLFYGIEYTDYLFSLPMGAGKTFLMAAIIYLDLYFALNEPENKQFAHNFLILAPSGLKSSIIPSLKTIEHFDPSWILPDPAASDIKRMIKFEVLDQPKSAKKSNKARNPNTQKIAGYQPFETLMGLIMVVNAEKVILDRLELSDSMFVIEKTDDEKDRFANELRNIIGKIPNLQIHIDEVHHAATDDIKLRQVVNKWNVNGTINSVLGFSGTPYLSSSEKIKVSESIQLKFSQITNTVFYYPLITAVEKFLKKPRIEQTSGLTSIQIINKGVKDFLATYGETVYKDGTIAKLAIYCGNIERLEKEVYPYLTGTLKISPDEILKYHKGNKTYSIPKEAEAEFNSLDTPVSKKRIILLVQIGKEGWDCKSLTGIILSQKNDCPTNMVLQTSCRCLRQVDKDNKNETAVIWLNEDNAKILDKQLIEEQQSSIQELNSSGKSIEPNMVERSSRIDYLKLPKLKFYQFNVEYETVISEGILNSEKNIDDIEVEDYLDIATIIERGLSPDGLKNKRIMDTLKGEPANFNLWVYTIARESMGGITVLDLVKYKKQLNYIFEKITYKNNDGMIYFNDLYRHSKIRSRIRLAFYKHRELTVRSEIIPKSANLLIIKKLTPIKEHDKLYPNKSDTKNILDADVTGKDIITIKKELEETQKKIQDFIASQSNHDLFNISSIDIQYSKTYSNEVLNKDRTFHYIPYSFARSRFELDFLKEVLALSSAKKLEVYYNGEQYLTEFRIDCYSENKNKQIKWTRVGLYTPDFLVIQRNNDNEIHKILMVETKGVGYANQPEFIERKKFVEEKFLEFNNEKYKHKRFDYLYIPDNIDMEKNIKVFNNKVENFFDIKDIKEN